MDEDRKPGLVKRALEQIKRQAGWPTATPDARRGDPEQRVERVLRETYDRPEETVRDRTAFRQ